MVATTSMESEKQYVKRTIQVLGVFVPVINVIVGCAPARFVGVVNDIEDSSLPVVRRFIHSLRAGTRMYVFLLGCSTYGHNDI